MLFLAFLLFCLLNERIHSFYLPTEYYYHRIKRQAIILRAQNYLKQYGYNENIPLCPNKEKNNFICANNSSKAVEEVTEEEALKRFQENAGLKQTGKIDNATIEMMEKPRCGNSDAQKIIKKDFLPLKGKWILYAYLNFTDKIDKKEIRLTLNKAFVVWEMVTPLKFYETRVIEKADIKILFAKGEHGDGDAFDGIPGGILAHGFPDGRMHFDDDENWTTYSTTDQPVYERKDLFWTAVHEIGHVLGLIHTGTEDSLMRPFYSNPVKRDTEGGNYSIPKPIKNDIMNVQKIYGGRVSKAGINKLHESEKCDEYCFI